MPPLRFQVHHTNGDHNDNRIDNLQLLCPNCHTQTDTYARNNIAKTNGFKITDRVDEILNGSESSFKPKDIEELKERILPQKEKKYCQVCGKEIKGDGEKYCSHKCAEKASRKFETTPSKLIEDFKELKSYCAVGRKYNVSDTAIKKRAKKLGVYDEIKKYIARGDGRFFNYETTINEVGECCASQFSGGSYLRADKIRGYSQNL